MTDLKDAMKSNEFFFIWGFRAFSFVVMLLLGIVGFFLTTTLSDVKGQIEKNSTNAWAAISKLSDTSQQATRDFGKLSQTVADHLHNQDDINSRLSKIEDDHENRIRVLEHPH